ncbi:MAG: relaxase domain-containing protein [Acidimicrobiales bacterium]
MLTAGAVAAGSGGYYVAGVAGGLGGLVPPAEDREAPVEWFGRAALGLGVEAGEFLDLLANRDPNTGRRMRTFQAGNGAYDLTFSAPLTNPVRVGRR